MNNKSPKNICFETYQVGAISVLRIFLLPTCNQTIISGEGKIKTHPTLQVIFDELKRAEAESGSCDRVFCYATDILSKKLPGDSKTLKALGVVLETFKKVFIIHLTWEEKTGQGITIFNNQP